MQQADDLIDAEVPTDQLQVREVAHKHVACSDDILNLTIRQVQVANVNSAEPARVSNDDLTLVEDQPAPSPKKGDSPF